MESSLLRKKPVIQERKVIPGIVMVLGEKILEATAVVDFI